MNDTTINTKKINSELTDLKQKVQNLHSLLIGFLGEDKEGKYRPEFVKKILKAIGEKTELSFENRATFLSQMKKHGSNCI